MNISHESLSLTEIIVVGFISTGVMDLGSMLGKKLAFHRGGSYSVLGAWFKGVLMGRVVDKTIPTMPKTKADTLIGIIGHYLIGILLTLVYVILMESISAPVTNIFWATIYGLFTSILPWFILFPALGFGLFAAKAPPGSRLLRSSLLNHLFFGIALGISLGFFV